MNKILCTLSPNRCNGLLSLSQGNLVVTTKEICDFHRSVFGNLAFGAGTHAFECEFWSNSNPAGGLVNLCSVGVASANSALNQCVGQGAESYGFRPSDGAGNSGIYNNNSLLTGYAQQGERQVIGVALWNDPVSPFVSWQVNGNYIGQIALTAGVLYVPAVSIGSDSPGDVSAFCNFGQRLFRYPIFTVNR